MAEKSKGFHLRRAWFPAGYYGANSIYQGYISLYYTQLGFSNAQLGLISAATALATLLFQPIWGALGDRMRRRRRLLVFLSLASACVLPIAALGRGFVLQICTAFAFYALFCNLLPLGDTLLLAGGDGCFGAYRLAGGASFAIVGALFGLIAHRFDEQGALWCAAALLLLTAVAALFLPDAPGQPRDCKNPFVTLKDKHFLAMLALLLPLQMTMGYFYTFYAPWFKEIGGGEALLGLGYFISAASEAPYLLLSERIYRRFGAECPMCISALLMALRWLLLGFARHPSIALLSQILHGGGFIVLSVSMAYWISEHVPSSLRASGQALLNMATFGIARITGNLLGGCLARGLGRGGAFLAASALCGAVFVIMLLMQRKWRALS